MQRAVTIEFGGVKAARQAIKSLDKVSQQAMAAAVNRTQSFAKSQIVKSIRENYDVSVADVRASISEKKRATKVDPVVVLRVRSSLQTIYHHFKVRPRVRPKKQRPYGVNVTIKKGSTGVMNGRVFLPAAGARKQKTQLWFRKGPSRHSPVVPLHTLSVAQMVNPEVKEAIDEQVGKKLVERFNHEMAFRLGTLGGKGGKAKT